MISWSVLWLLLALSITVSLGLRLENLTQQQVACKQAKAPGLCRGRQLRYAYNKETDNCESFYYTGCASTDNNFLTYEECRRDCMQRGRY
ncbi:chymotrypsin inhibitor SCI-III isoform X2 [Drosophila albomicans]|uniref:Chymotrypsin inhibitor SCI-III isoform X2 n=1 Tax=Drosophila albomicans TaxID=7291 RepID=A0A9C6SYZ6_DROAB|nr:chymotrypsin inhibitor SCI-III isoform X2 [Drosophila albomicans]